MKKYLNNICIKYVDNKKIKFVCMIKDEINQTNNYTFVFI